MPDNPIPQPSGSVRRNAALIVTIVLAVTLVGFLSGIKEPAPLERPAEAEAPRQRDHDVPDAARYADLSIGTIRPHIAKSDLSTLISPRPGPFEPSLRKSWWSRRLPIVRTDEMKMLALEDRAKWRAFDGAPPVIPHPVDFMQTANCIACHGSGLRIGDKLATKISHPYLSNCAQCHVESVRPDFATFASLPIENSFIGPVRSGPGERAWLGAPPTIPHTTWLRQDCSSCHGLVARPGIRTTHPWLTNCTQCHTSSATLDQVDFPPLNSGLSR